MDSGRPRDRFRRLAKAPRRSFNRFTCLLWGTTIIMILQFLVPVALNSCEALVKPNELCSRCKSPGGINFCPIDPTNRTCPECGREWTAPYHEVVSLPWILYGVRALFRW
jgi:hypothetical protein